MSHVSVIRDIADPMFRQLSREVVAAMERLHVPGVAVGLIDVEMALDEPGRRFDSLATA